jgi:hypothetical protein
MVPLKHDRYGLILGWITLAPCRELHYIVNSVVATPEEQIPAGGLIMVD